MYLLPSPVSIAAPSDPRVADVSRKIRCCGNAACGNCIRAGRICEYAPVPQEVNKATRERKAIAKASKHNSGDFLHSPASAYGFDTPQSVSSAQTPSVTTLAPSLPIHPPRAPGHRRASSTPVHPTLPPYVPPPAAPQLASPAMFESSSWMYSGWSSHPPVPLASAPNTPLRVFPSAVAQNHIHSDYMGNSHLTPPHAEANGYHHRHEMPPVPLTYDTPKLSPVPRTYEAPNLPTPPDSGSESRSTQWSYPGALLPAPTYSSSYPAPLSQSPLTTPISEYPVFNAVPHSPPSTPSTGSYFSSYSTSSAQAQAQPFFYIPPSPERLRDIDTSPTLVPERTMHKGLVGLGIGLASMAHESEPTYSTYTPMDTAYAPMDMDYYQPALV